MAWIFNLILPGTGLIFRRREWVGFLLCLVFGLCGNVALAGLLIAPESLPAWSVDIAIGLAALTWIASQALLWQTRSRGAS